MPYRLKKFIGMVLLVALVIIYALVAMAIASARLAESPWYIHLAFFGLSGVAWVVPAMGIIWWMERPPKHKDAG